jgi:hypothetical protein
MDFSLTLALSTIWFSVMEGMLLLPRIFIIGFGVLFQIGSEVWTVERDVCMKYEKNDWY